MLGRMLGSMQRCMLSICLGCSTHLPILGIIMVIYCYHNGVKEMLKYKINIFRESLEVFRK